MSSSLRNLSKRYGTNLDRFPSYLRKMFERMSRDAQLPALTSDVAELPQDRRYKSPKQWTVQPGDRVLLTKGKYRGHVTKVLGLHHPTNRVFVETADTKKVVVPKQFWQAGQSSHMVNYPKTVRPQDLKVVGTVVETAADGTEREKDIAADQLVFKGEYWDDDYHKMMPYRRIKFHENIIIPWPRPEPEEDCPFSTPVESVEERTYVPNCLVRTDAPAGIVESMRDPLMKRGYKWDKKIISHSEAKRLAKPNMPISEAKQAMIDEKIKIKASIPKEPTKETIDIVGSRVAKKLNEVTDVNFAQWVESVSPEAGKAKKEAHELAKKIRDEKIREAQEKNRLQRKVLSKYNVRREDRGKKVF